jgi:ATP-dependent Clp protease protease subunit
MGRPTAEAKTARPSNNDQVIEELAQMAAAASQADGSRIIMMHGEVNESTIAQVIAHMLHLASVNTKPINLVISTYGGSVDEMFSLYDTIKFLPCPVHTIALGKVMSAGVLLLATGQKGYRLIGRSARIMVHPMSGHCFGNIFEIENEKKEMDRMQELMVGCLSSETGMTKRTINKIMKKGHDHYLTPAQAMELGIVDRIVGE